MRLASLAAARGDPGDRGLISPRAPAHGGEIFLGAVGAFAMDSYALLGRGAGNPLLRGGRGFRPVRGCRNHMNDLVAAAFQLVENFGQREDGARVNVVQQQDALAARLDTADGASRNLAITDAALVLRPHAPLSSHIAT